MTANAARGDVPITLKRNGVEREFVMRPSFTAIAEVEQATGQGFFQLARKVSTGDLSLSAMAAIVTAGMKAAGETASVKPVGEMIFETGMVNVLQPVTRWISNAVTGGKDPEPGEAAAVTTATGDTPSDA